MRTLIWYLDEAKEKQGFTSDRQLNHALGATGSLVTRYRSNKMAPSPKMMVKLAELAGVPPEIALADLGYWTNFDSEAADVYHEMASIVAKAKGFAAATIIGTGLLTASIAADFEPTAHAEVMAPVRDITSPNMFYIMGNISASIPSAYVGLALYHSGLNHKEW